MSPVNASARRIECGRRAELVRGRLFDDAVLNRYQGEPAALRKSQRRDPRRIDEGLAYQEVEGTVGIEGEIGRRAAAAGVLDAARAEAVDGERHIAPGRDPFAPALVEALPIAVAAVQQHHGGRGVGTVGLPQIALQRLRAGQRIFELDDGRSRLRHQRGALGRACDHQGAGEGCGCGEVHRGPPFRLALRRSINVACQIPNSFRALAFITFGLISSRISSLAKSASQRSGVITGQSEPNSILSCRMELM